MAASPAPLVVFRLQLGDSLVVIFSDLIDLLRSLFRVTVTKLSEILGRELYTTYLNYIQIHIDYFDLSFARVYAPNDTF